jgi:hypothetical protein
MMMRLGRRVAGLFAVALVAGACAATTTPKPAAAPPKSAAVDPAAEQQTQKAIVAALDDIALGRGEYHKHLAVPFMIGPALWGAMLQLEPALEKIGTESVSIVPMGDRSVTWKMRMFDGEGGPQIARHIKFRAVAEAFRGGTVRPATPQERSLFYALTPFETEGQPLTIIVAPEGHRMVVYADGDGQLVWMDILSEYKTTIVSPR